MQLNGPAGSGKEAPAVRGSSRGQSCCKHSVAQRLLGLQTVLGGRRRQPWRAARCSGRERGCGENAAGQPRCCCCGWCCPAGVNLQTARFPAQRQGCEAIAWAVGSCGAAPSGQPAGHRGVRIKRHSYTRSFVLPFFLYNCKGQIRNKRPGFWRSELGARQVHFQ